MRIFLPLIAALLISMISLAQPEHSIDPGSLPAGVYNDPNDPAFTTTTVNGETWRQNVPPDYVKYNHFTQNFAVNGAWLTPFNIGPDLDGYGANPGNNADYFQFQGTNQIAGTGVIMFDTVHFDIGAGNVMNITSTNAGYLSAEFFHGQPPGGIAVTRTLLFNNGITSTDRAQAVNGAIVFIRNANFIGGLNDAQHVDGFVSEFNSFGGTQPLGHGGDFTFPVGDAASVYQLRREGVFDDFDHTLTVGWVNEDPYDPLTLDPTQSTHNSTGVLPPGIEAMAKAGFWDWHFKNVISDPESAAYEGAIAMSQAQTITVSIPDLTAFPGLLASQLRLIGYNPTIQEWIDLSTASGLPTPYASGLTKGSTLKGIIPQNQLITALAIGSSNDIILPVTFSSFTVKSEGCKALLQWETSSEQNNSHFTVERSTDGSVFTAIARVGAVGNSNSLNRYKYTDEAPGSGTNYYRITQVDFDGKYSSTEIKVVKIQCSGGNEALLRAYPNPATNQVYIQTGKAVARVNILSSNGQTVLKYMPSQTEGGGTFPINIQRLQKGVYLLQLVNKDGTVNVIKLLKQ